MITQQGAFTGRPNPASGHEESGEPVDQLGIEGFQSSPGVPQQQFFTVAVRQLQRHIGADDMAGVGEARPGPHRVPIKADRTQPTGLPRLGGGLERRILVSYLRDGDKVYETYWTTGRGNELMAPSYGLLDLTVYGRHELWEDSPEGWPQRWGSQGGQFRLDGRPTSGAVAPETVSLSDRSQQAYPNVPERSPGGGVGSGQRCT